MSKNGLEDLQDNFARVMALYRKAIDESMEKVPDDLKETVYPLMVGFSAIDFICKLGGIKKNGSH